MNRSSDAINGVQRALDRARQDLGLGRRDDALACLEMGRRALDEAIEAMRVEIGGVAPAGANAPLIFGARR